MITDRRFALRFDAEPSWNERLLRFLGHYDTRVYVTKDAYFDFGAGSLGALDRLTGIHQPHGHTGLLGSVGRWCEFSESSEIICRGDHDHDQSVNLSLGLLRPFSATTGDVGMKPFGNFTIGSGVVVSAGARILSGAIIGDGAVIGANTAARRAAPFAIVSGVPAKEIRKRPVQIAWWDWPVEYLIANLGDIQAVAVGPANHPVQADRNRFILIRGERNYVVSGFVENGVERPIAEAPVGVQAYLEAAFAPDMREAYWLPDCWTG